MEPHEYDHVILELVHCNRYNSSMGAPSEGHKDALIKGVKLHAKN